MTIEKALTPIESNEPFLRNALESMAEQLDGVSAASELAATQLYVVDYSHGPKGLTKSPWYTANLAAFRRERAIVVNEAYLLECEAAVRSFALPGELLATPYLRSDEDLFGLVDRVRSAPSRYLQRLRALDRLPGRDGADAENADSFMMLLMFLVGHEVGHLVQGHDQRAFGAFVDPKAPPETKLGNAVVKLTRHAREFTHLGFDLPGFSQLLDETSEAGANVKLWQDALADLERNHARWFDDETGADDHAASLVQEVLDRIAAVDPARADRLLAGVVNALFAAALFQWQRDLAAFLGKLGIDRLSNTSELALTMVQQRENYIHAAELFGPVHRFTLLRAVLAINGWLHARGLMRAPLGAPIRRVAPDVQRQPLDPGVASQCLQRELLLRIHLDTAIKIAHVGAITGWMLDKDAERGTPQLFMMQFESIRQSVARLQRMM